MQQLIDSGHVYRDYSTEADRAAEKAAAERAKRAYRFRRQALPPSSVPGTRAKAARTPCGFRCRWAEPWSFTT